MRPVFRAAASAQALGTSLQVALPAGAVAGDLVLLAVSVQGSASVSCPGFTLLRRSYGLSSPSTAPVSLVTLWRVLDGSETSPLTVTLSTGVSVYCSVVAVAWRSVSAGVPVRVWADAVSATSDGDAVAPSVTPGIAQSLLVGVFGQTQVYSYGNAVTFTPPAGMTERADSGGASAGVMVAEQALSSAGASGTRTANASDWGAWAAQALVLQSNTAPTAPVLTAPGAGAVLDRTVGHTFAATFTDPDLPGDSPSQSWWRYRLVGAPSWTTVTQVSTAQTRAFAAGAFAAGDYEWQVAYRDAQGEPLSEAALVWSASGFFTAATPPAGPTITAPASGSTIGTTRAQVLWSFPTQQAYEVRKVADNAGAPDTATVLFTTGAVTSSTARSVWLDFDVNNRAEHVQVRVQDSASGLWSPWTSVRVLVAWSPPETPSLTVRPDGAAIVVSPVLPRRNMLTLAQATLEPSATGWYSMTNCSVARSIEQAAEGVASLKMTATAAGLMAARSGTTPTNGLVRVTPGTVVTVSAWFRAATTGRSVLLYGTWYNAVGGSTSGTPLGQAVTDTTTGWVQAQLTVAVPSGAAYLRVQPRVEGCAAGEAHYVDKVRVRENPLGNLLGPGSFAGGVEGWGQIGGGTAAVAHDTTVAFTGTGSLAVTPNGAALSGAFRSVLGVPGVPHSARVWLRPTTTQGYALMLGATTGPAVVCPAGQWTALTITNPDGGTSQTLAVRQATGGDGSVFRIGGVQAVVGQDLPEFTPDGTVNLTALGLLVGAVATWEQAVAEDGLPVLRQTGTGSASAPYARVGAYSIPVQGGVDYTWAATVEHTAGTAPATANLRITYYDASNATVATVNSPSLPPTGLRTRRTLTATAPATATSAAVWLITSPQAVDSVVEWSRVQMTRGGGEVGYVDVDSGAGVWSGTAHASTSERIEPWAEPAPPVTTVEVWRRQVGDTGPGLRLAVNGALAPNVAADWTDCTPASRVEYEYRLRVLTDTGTHADSAWAS